MEMVRELIGWLRALEETAVALGDRRIGLGVLAFCCRSIHLPLCDVINLIR